MCQEEKLQINQDNMSSLWINDVFIVFMQQEKKLTFFKMLSTDLMRECDEIVKDIEIYSRCLDENFELYKKLDVKQHVLICNKIVEISMI